MSSKLKDVARAIEGPHLPVAPGSTYTLEELRVVRWEACSDHERAVRLGEARAAVEALREPTEAMLLRGCEAGLSTDVLLDDARFACERAQWTAMIDSILNPAKGE